MSWQLGPPLVESAAETAKPRRRAHSPNAGDELPPAENRQNFRSLFLPVWGIASATGFPKTRHGDFSHDQNLRLGLRDTRGRSAGTEDGKTFGHGSQSLTTPLA